MNTVKTLLTYISFIILGVMIIRFAFEEFHSTKRLEPLICRDWFQKGMLSLAAILAILAVIFIIK